MNDCHHAKQAQNRDYWVKSPAFDHWHLKSPLLSPIYIVSRYITQLMEGRLGIRFVAAAISTVLFLGSCPAMAAPPQLSPGMTVMDTAGGKVGTIDSVTVDNAVIATGAHKVALPFTSFGMGVKGPIIGLTRAELDAAAEKAAANAAAALRAQMLPGVAVFGSQGNNLGTIKAIDGDYLLLTTASGDAKLPIVAIGNGQKGLMVNMTAAELKAAISSAS